MKKDPYSQEFPLLPAFGLYASNTLGDGNCLFNALSDQLYGTQNNHHEVRMRSIDHMRQHKNYFAQFVDVLPGGATRRQPKRKSAKGYSTPSDSSLPSPEDVEKAIEQHITRMAQGGTYGDNMEIVAFARAYNVNVMIWQQNHRYQVDASSDPARSNATLHIAYHEWEHYSSIRNIDGPHQGLPEVKLEQATSDVEAKAKANIANAPTVAQWQIDNVEAAVSSQFPVSREAIVEALEAKRGNVDEAFEKLFSEQQEPSNLSGNSSSVERELDTEDEPGSSSNKRQDRRLSRNTKAVMRRRAEQKKEEIAAKLSNPSSDSYETLVNSHPTLPRHGYMRYVVPDDDTDDDSPPPLKDSETSSNSEYSVPSLSNPRQSLKISLNPKTTQHSDTKAVSKNHSPPKRLASARDKKTMKKQAQKAAAKERRQMVNNTKKRSSPSPAGHMGASNHPAMTTGLKVLHI